MFKIFGEIITNIFDSQTKHITTNLVSKFNLTHNNKNPYI